MQSKVCLYGFSKGNRDSFQSLRPLTVDRSQDPPVNPMSASPARVLDWMTWLH